MQRLIEYEQSTGIVRTVFDDIRATRKTTDINNFWKALANHRESLAKARAARKRPSDREIRA